MYAIPQNLSPVVKFVCLRFFKLCNLRSLKPKRWVQMSFQTHYYYGHKHTEHLNGY